MSLSGSRSCSRIQGRRRPEIIDTLLERGRAFDAASKVGKKVPSIFYVLFHNQKPDVGF